MRVTSSELVRHHHRMSRLNVSLPSRLSRRWVVSEAALLIHRPVKSKNIRGINHWKHHLQGGGASPKGFLHFSSLDCDMWHPTRPIIIPPTLSITIRMGEYYSVVCTSVPLNGSTLSMLHCQGASATWPNCNRLQSALGSDPRLCISAFLPISLSPTTPKPAPPKTDGD